MPNSLAQAVPIGGSRTRKPTWPESPMPPVTIWDNLGRVLNAAPDIADLPSGYRFGNYVIVERIGRGGMAGVYRAEHVALRKQVALKVMDHAVHDRTVAHRQFLREGRAAAAVKHPNIVDITDVGVWQGVPYLVMELLEGWDLETHLLERGPLPDGELVRLALPVIAGLAVAHDAGVVHRDLKPSNIFLARGADGDQLLKVVDFGISKQTHDGPDLTATPYGALMGTPLYLPPEALGGTAAFTPASDQYSLGVVLYECATGKLPFQEETLVGLLQRIAAGNFDPPSRIRPDISALVERAIVRALHRNPLERFAHLRDLGRALWEVASPRTQVVWARTFADANPSAPNVGVAPPSRATSALGRESQQTFSNTRRTFVHASVAVSRARRKLAWLLAIPVLALGAIAASRWFSANMGPRGEALLSLSQPREAQRPDGSARSAVRPSVAPPAGAALSPAANPAAAPPPGAFQPRTSSISERKARATRAGRRTSEVPLAPAHPPRRATPEAAASPLPSGDTGSSGDTAFDPEFPGLRLAPPKAPSEPRREPIGANQSPILD